MGRELLLVNSVRVNHTYKYNWNHNVQKRTGIMYNDTSLVYFKIPVLEGML